jgi:hypothetical protein
MPTAAMSNPPSAGPITFAPLNTAALSATALARCGRDTSFGRMESRAGQSKVIIEPTMIATTRSRSYVIVPVAIM